MNSLALQSFADSLEKTAANPFKGFDPRKALAVRNRRVMDRDPGWIGGNRPTAGVTGRTGTGRGYPLEPGPASGLTSAQRGARIEELKGVRAGRKDPTLPAPEKGTLLGTDARGKLPEVRQKARMEEFGLTSPDWLRNQQQRLDLASGGWM
jgi:hypothetical protein